MKLISRSKSDSESVKNRIIIVGACNNLKKLSSYSNNGADIDIVAPGDNINSLIINDEYEFMSGTSMATPFVSATAALIFSINPDLTGADVKNIIISSSTESIGYQDYNYPLLNIKNALDNTK